ncbi:hypothetical protein KY290_036162 [Solanum tuberosum]|uniref:Uncharacterized protein n=1 Tax=Solanum tuberosum TaxID=4113 RepID=A0ABQ7TRV6_SOLTU|nr:hypothetical protein KY285_035441 [Solanum tuberosum]KAH0737457.1 hypothetical protein KY290_036162 [Solanum tuberosum]
MAQKKKKKKCVSSHGHENLANRKAPNKKKFILNTKNSNQIISNGEEKVTQKFNKKKKKKSVRPYQISGKSIVEPSNDNTDQMEIDQRGEAKHLTEDWEGAVADLKEAAEKSS